ncbi:ribosome biogenesis protein [Schizosaccharomyces japonicus yFS275]|uniref:Ribosome biogenesis protein n=1 Tax=Schizosaccharomyces japonicus (strain yFS275 / FY16936) TaxID=402676 RepID=B6K153_SCHJY|nr:ribosome biogenesis protein [Schizosaccharomyces japonicus yFS275]EEB07674.1 ribosome biogenesis protein [Schizosaccharomyces japonicus yFS275]
MFNSKKYLNSYGWQEGSALKDGGLKKPILTSRKYDTRGLGSKTDHADQWWDDVFSSQLQSIKVEANHGKIKVQSTGAAAKIAMAKFHSKFSPLSTVFRHGGVLTSTIEEKKSALRVESHIIERADKKSHSKKRKRDDTDRKSKKSHKKAKEKSSKSEKKHSEKKHSKKKSKKHHHKKDK